MNGRILRHIDRIVKRRADSHRRGTGRIKHQTSAAQPDTSLINRIDRLRGGASHQSKISSLDVQSGRGEEGVRVGPIGVREVDPPRSRFSERHCPPLISDFPIKRDIRI